MRIKFFISTVALAAVVAFPVVSNAQTNEFLLQQISSLLAQVQYLQAQLQQVEGGSQVGPVTTTNPGTAVVTTGTAATKVCVDIAQNLDLGDENDEVRELQQELAKFPAIYPDGIVSGYYGGLTVAAVKRFQAQNGVVSSGTAATTGYGAVGPKTRQALKAGCSGAVYNEAVHRDLVVTPTVGPLPTQVTATFSLNGSSCSSFRLDWGDGTPPVTFDAENTSICTKDIAHKRATHTYNKPGTHRIRLYAAHGPLSSVSLVNNIDVSIGDTAPTNFSLSPTSGSAPLTTSITFPVRGSDCTSYEANWGDGTIDRHQASYFDGCLNDSGTQSLTHTYVSGGTYAVSLKTGHAPVHELDISERWSVVVQDDIVPGAAVEVSPTAGTAPLTVKVNMYGYGEACNSYSLDWGDGSSIQKFEATETGCGEEVFQKVFSHTYIAPGAYTIRSKIGTATSLSSLPINTQNVVVSDAPGCPYPDTPVCGELIYSCPVGYTCSQTYETFANQCALEDAGAEFVHVGECQL